jgi:hypothetical protein
MIILITVVVNVGDLCIPNFKTAKLSLFPSAVSSPQIDPTTICVPYPRYCPRCPRCKLCFPREAPARHAPVVHSQDSPALQRDMSVAPETLPYSPSPRTDTGWPQIRATPPRDAQTGSIHAMPPLFSSAVKKIATQCRAEAAHHYAASRWRWW